MLTDSWELGRAIAGGEKCSRSRRLSLFGLALYAEIHSDVYRRIESVAEAKGKLRARNTAGPMFQIRFGQLRFGAGSLCKMRWKSSSAGPPCGCRRPALAHAESDSGPT